MYTLLSPQKARNEKGAFVQVADRHTVEYVEHNRKAIVEVEFGRPISIYAATLSDWIYDAGHRSMEPTEAAEVVSQMEEGLKAMGSAVEIV